MKLENYANIIVFYKIQIKTRKIFNIEVKTSDQKCADRSPLCLGTVLSCSLKKFSVNSVCKFEVCHPRCVYIN